MSDSDDSETEQPVDNTPDRDTENWIVTFFTHPELKDEGWEDLSKDGDIKKKVITKAPGNAQSVAYGMDITCRFRGILTRTEEEIESSNDEPTTLTLGKFGFPFGILSGIKSMRVGEKSVIRVSPEQGFGEQGNPEKNVPPQSPLDYEIEILSAENLVHIWDGVLKRILDEGEGKEKPGEFGTLTFSYTARLSESDEKTTFDEGDHIQWNMEEESDRYPDGLKIAVSCSNLGETSLFKLMPEVMYGETGYDEFSSGASVPPNSVVWYQITLHSFENELTEHDCQTLEEFLQIIQKHRERGNQFFREHDLDKAMKRYEKADSVLGMKFRDDNDPEILELKCKIWNNMALIAFKWGEWEFLMKKVNSVLEISPTNVKALTRRAEAYLAQLEFDDAKADLKAALEVEPHNQYVQKVMKTCKKQIKQYKEMRKKKYANFLK